MAADSARKVTVVEFLDRILPGMDSEVCRQCQRLFEKQGIVFRLSSKVTAVDASGAVLQASVEPAAGGAAETLEADVVLVAIGRVPYTEGLGLEAVGVKTDNRGRVVVDAHYATSVAGIYAIGDVIAGPMLAHKAEDEGVAVAEILAGQAGHVNYDVIPNVVYTFPEIASVGKTEEELKVAGTAYSVGKFPFTANGRAKANHQTDGFVKILADAKTDRVLGVHIVGSDAGNMIAEAAVAMEFGASAEDIARTCHAHPTLPEAVKEAALAVEARDSYVMVPSASDLYPRPEEPPKAASRRARPMGAWLYMLKCSDGSYYTGTTRADIERRIGEHQSGALDGFGRRTRASSFETRAVGALLRMRAEVDRSGEHSIWRHRTTARSRSSPAPLRASAKRSRSGLRKTAATLSPPTCSRRTRPCKA